MWRGFGGFGEVRVKHSESQIPGQKLLVNIWMVATINSSEGALDSNHRSLIIAIR